MLWFKKWGRQKPSQLYLNQQGDISMLPRYTSPPQKNTAEWIDYFRRTPRLAVVERIASDLSFAPGRLFQADGSGEESELLNHPFLTFWNRANPMHEFSTAALWRLFEIYLLLKGEGYLVIERDVLGRPSELWPVPVHWVQMTPYQGHPFYTIRTTAGLLMEVSVDDMFVMKDLDPYDPFQRGLGQSESLADEIEIDEYAAKFQKNFFLNDATPGTIVTMEDSTGEQRERVLASWEERFKGIRNSHKLNIVKGKISVQKLSDNMKDIDMIQGRMFLRDAVLEHYGVPREIMGITESSNRATSEAAQFIYAQNVLMPKLRRREEAINTQLLPLFGEGLVWRFDDIVPRNQEFDKVKAMDAYNAGLITKNEARKLLDMGETENGNVFKTTFSDVYLSEEEDPTEVSYDMAELQFADTEAEDTPSQEAAEDPEEEPGKGASYQERNRQAKSMATKSALDTARRRETRNFEKAIQGYFQKQGSRIDRALDGATKSDRSIWDSLKDQMPEQDWQDGGFVQLDQEEREKLVNRFVLDLTDWNGEEAILLGLLTPLWGDAYGAGAKASQSLYRLNGIQRPELTAFARKHGAQRVKAITNATKDQLSRIVANALETGETNQQIARKIKTEMRTTEKRAKTIAAQECNTSLIKGSFDMMQQAGAKLKTWHVTNPSVARDTHKALNNTSVPIDKPFKTASGAHLMMPCDPDCNKPEEVINCHCWLTYDDI